MRPVVISTVEGVRETVNGARRSGRTIGLVPTMGALHAGHVSLFRAARRETGFVVGTIFVNPTQFGPSEDFSRYPRPLEKDLAICAEVGVDLVFAPEVETLYPQGSCTYVEVHGLQEVLCGTSRPGHFRGVATIVLKLFNIVQPDLAFFGQKDAQQALIIRQMVRDLNLPVEVRVCPIVREPDGLALSSRNQYLDADQRRRAVVLHQALEEGRGRVETGERDGRVVQQGMIDRIKTTPGAQLDYAAVVDANTLRPLSRLSGEILLALAVKFGATRLIDNVQLQI